jgi:hypothetical protein
MMDAKGFLFLFLKNNITQGYLAICSFTVEVGALLPILPQAVPDVLDYQDETERSPTMIIN